MRIFQHKWLSILMSPLAALYGGVVRARNRCYDSGLLAIERAPCRVVSVGNLTAGGTGKTPATLFLAERFRAQGKKVVILSRGYRRQSRGLVLVSDGHRLLTSPRQAGDEAYLIARRLNGVPVVVDKDRRRAVGVVVDRFAADVILLDDGFQHRSLGRDEDHVLVSAASGFCNGRLLPAGPLREPLSALARATQVWITKISGQESLTDLVTLIRRHTDAPIRLARHRPAGCMLWPAGHEVPLTTLRGKKAFCFAGIAEPKPFFAAVQEAGAEIVGTRALRDHVRYTTRRAQGIYQDAFAAEANVLVTTEKDAIKFPAGPGEGLPMYSLTVEFEPVEEAATENARQARC